MKRWIELTCSRSCHESTKECAGRENRDNKGFGGRRDHVTTWVAGQVSRGETKLLQPCWDLLDTTDNTSIVSEQDTTERAES